MRIESIDNKGENTLVNLLKREIMIGSKIAVASAYFSIYAYDALRKEMEESEEFKFLYTKPTFYKIERDLIRQYKLQATIEVRFSKIDSNKYEIQIRNKMSSPTIANNINK